jgi:hypothetical protein
MPVTIHDLSLYWGLRTNPDGSYTWDDIAKTGLH